MSTRLCILTLSWALFLVSRLAFALDTYPFAVTVEKEPSGHRIVARNDGPAPVSVRVSLPMKVNAKTDRPLPFYAVVPPNGGVLHLARVTTVLDGASSTFKTESTWALGDFNALPDGALYRLPYPDNYTFRIGQAPGGPITTHTAPDSRFAVDIPMPEGTPVVAARDGLVIKTRADQVKGGKDLGVNAAANVVDILHADGTIALYAHLAPGGVRVYPGQRVSAGTVIGLAGSTGYSSGPHLHMAVLRLVRTNDGFRSESIPFQFYVGAPARAFSPVYGQLVKADYTEVARLPVTAEQEAERVALPSTPMFGSAAGGSLISPTFSLEIPESLVRKLRSIEPWQWFIAIVVFVVAAIIASNARDRQRRRAWDRLRGSEPHI